MLNIEADKIEKTYGVFKAVKGVSFQIKQNTAFGFLGPNGAGKTTILKMLYGKCLRDSKNNTKLLISGFDPSKNALAIRKITGVVPQEDNLDLELSVEENLMIFAMFYGIKRSEAKKRILEQLDFMELVEKRNSKIKELSGGMQRRLVIARALLNNPKILILDEPTTGLDPQVRHLIWEKLRKLKEHNVTIVLTTHYMEEAFQLCDDIMIMDNGLEVMTGNPMYLLDNNIEKYVLEVYKGNIDEIIDIRMESWLDRKMFYANDFKALQDIAEKLTIGTYFLRQTNLEDLFLKTTGRSLNEQ